MFDLFYYEVQSFVQPLKPKRIIFDQVKSLKSSIEITSHIKDLACDGLTNIIFQDLNTLENKILGI